MLPVWANQAQDTLGSAAPHKHRTTYCRDPRARSTMGTIFESSFGGNPVMGSCGGDSFTRFGPPVDFEAGFGRLDQWREEKSYSSDSCLSSDTPELSSRPSSRNSSRPSSYHSSSRGSHRSSYSSLPDPEPYTSFGWSPTIFDCEISSQSQAVWSSSSYSIPEYSSWPPEYTTTDNSSLPVHDSLSPPALPNISPAQFSFPSLESAKLQTPLHFVPHPNLFEYPKFPPSVALGPTFDWTSSELGPFNSITSTGHSRELHNVYSNRDSENVLKDLKADLLTHSKERLEKCPIVTCNYHVKGFCRKYDKQRHILTHFKGTLVCNFCPGRGTPTAKSFQRADIFKRHLVSVHGAEYTPTPSSRKKWGPKSKLYTGKSSAGHWPGSYGNCSNCSVIYYDAQSFYNHLDECVTSTSKQIHTLPHFKSTLVCNFCPGWGTPAAKTFQRADVFKRHLVSTHGAECTPKPFSRRSSSQKSTFNGGDSTGDHWPCWYGSCSTCLAIYDDAQSFYNHLDDCVISRVLLQASVPLTNTSKRGEMESRTSAKDHAEKSRVSDLVHHTTELHEAMEKPEVINEVEDWGRKRRKNYTPSWGKSGDQINMKKRVMNAFDGTRRLWKDETIYVPDIEANMPWSRMESYNNDSDALRMMQPEFYFDQTFFKEGDKYPAYIDALKEKYRLPGDGSSSSAKSPGHKIFGIDQTLTDWVLNSGKLSAQLTDTYFKEEARLFLASTGVTQKPNGTGWLDNLKRKTGINARDINPRTSDTHVSASDWAASQRRPKISRTSPLSPKVQPQASKTRGQVALLPRVAYKKEISEPGVKKEADLILSSCPNIEQPAAETPGNDCGSFAPSPETNVSEDASDRESISDCSTAWGDDEKTSTPGSDVYRVLADSCDSHIAEEKNLLRPVLSPMKQALVDRIMDEFWTIVNQEWAANLTKCAGETPASSSPPGSNGSLIGGSSPRMANRKRQRDDEEPPPDDNNGRTPKRPNSQPEKTPPKNGIKFACPYRKHAPHKYTIYKHRSCALSHWDTVARVKEHLYRRHRVPIQCKRCWQTFKMQEALDAHLTVVNICSLKTGQATEGLTADLEKKLKSRKKSSPDQTEEARWKEIYGLLFPNEVVPNPYFEPVQENGPQSPDSRELADYEEYSRQELPRYFRSYLEDAVNNETQHLEEHMRSQLVSIVQDCQARIFSAYKSRNANKESKPNPRSTVIDVCVTPPASQVSAEDAVDAVKTESENIVVAAYQPPPPTPQNTLQYLPDLRDIQIRTMPAKTLENPSFSDSAYSSNGTVSSQSIPMQSQAREFVQPKPPVNLYGQFPPGDVRMPGEDLDGLSFDEAYNIPLDLNDPAFESWWENLEPEN